MKKILLSLALSIPFFAYCQKWEVGVFAGTSHYNGDLSEGVFMPKTLHPAVGGIIRYNINYKWSIRAGGYYGTVSGNDAYATDEKRRARNLNFTSPITELSVIPEFHFSGYKIRHGRYRFSPFAYAGIGIFKFNPQTVLDGTTWNLQQMRTEGQGSTFNQQDEQKNAGYPQQPYALTQVCIPMGLGIKYAIGRNINFTFEVSARKLFTDYLDDVSHWYVPEKVFYQTSGDYGYRLMDRRSELSGKDVPAEDKIAPRGNSTTNDWYYFTGITLTYTFFPPSCFKF
ncbi:hypothetical protein GC194_01705 [bacterium]|nr:hypothetical protein [bacterium]